MKAIRRSTFVVICLLCLYCCASCVLLQAQVIGGMLHPDLDRPGEPFSYFRHPTDVIGALFAPVASEVTPEGYVYTGFGELMFFIENPPETVDERIKTLREGYLPIVQYKFRRRGVRYSFTMFGADLGQGLQGLPVNFVEVEVRNDTNESRTAFLSSAYRFASPTTGLRGIQDYRFRQRFDLIPTQYTKGQTTADASWQYSFRRNALVRNGRLLYLFPTNPEPYSVSLSLNDNGLRIVRYLSGEIEGDPHPKYHLDSQTPMGVVTYRVSLQPGAHKSLTFKMPIVPIPENSLEAEQVIAADYSHYFRDTVSFWKELVAKSPPLHFPEAKVQEALLANTVFDLLAIDKVGDDYIPNVNKFQYHYFYASSDTDHMLVGLDYMGLQEISGKAALYGLKVQSEEGYYLPHDDSPTVHHWEMWGNTLWNWGRHYLLTRDRVFLEQVYPSVLRAMDWEQRTTKEDPLGLMPVYTNPDDAFLKDVHQTGQDIWTLVGIRNAMVMAEGMGRKQDVGRIKAEYERFWKAFEKQLDVQTSKARGYIPPGLDRTLQGNNWDNLLTLYPEPLFDPFDRRVTATIRESRKSYVEGILGYVLPVAQRKRGDSYEFDSTRLLHYWHSLDNAENALVRGGAEDQELAVKDLYAMLLHSTSTHSLQEFGTTPWSTRDYVDHDILPDGAASGVLIELIRNMLVREYKNELFLFSAISPAWLGPNKSIEIRDEPTIFGPVTAILRGTSGGLNVNLSNRFWRAPEHIVIRIPWFYEVQQAEADGRPVKLIDGNLTVSPRIHEVRLRGRIKQGAHNLSYEDAVQNYKREYKQRYAEFLQTGKIRP